MVPRMWTACPRAGTRDRCCWSTVGRAGGCAPSEHGLRSCPPDGTCPQAQLENFWSREGKNFFPILSPSLSVVFVLHAGNCAWICGLTHHTCLATNAPLPFLQPCRLRDLLSAMSEISAGMGKVPACRSFSPGSAVQGASRWEATMCKHCISCYLSCQTQHLLQASGLAQLTRGLIQNCISFILQQVDSPSSARKRSNPG